MPKLVNSAARLLMRSYPFPRGQGRIIDRTALGRLTFEEADLVVRASDGFSIKIMPNDHIGRHIYLTGQFDRTIVEVLLHCCRDGDRILDIGANIGYVSCVLRYRRKDVRLVAVEPRPDCYIVLTENLLRWKDRSCALNAAVSNMDGKGTMMLDARNTGASRLVKSAPRERGAGARRFIEVPLITGRSLMDRIGLDSLDLVKIDVEGHEEAVFETLASVIALHRPRAIVFEHGANINRPNSPIRRIMGELKYEIFGLRKTLLRWSLMPVVQLGQLGRRAHDYVTIPVERKGLC